MAENVNLGKAALTPTALSVAELARLLRHAGAANLTEEIIRADIVSGAPTNADGTVNLVHYTAWLASEVSRGN